MRKIDKIKYIRIKTENENSYSEDIPIGANAENIDMRNGNNLQDTIGNLDIDNNDNITEQLTSLRNTTNQLDNNKLNKSDVINYVPPVVTDWLQDNVTPVGSAVTIDKSLSIEDSAADAKIVGDALNNIDTETNTINRGINNIGDYAKKTIMKEILYPVLPFEIGAISISTSGWEYVNNNKRIRTPYGKEIFLNTGDVIGLTDYTNTRFYLGARLENGSYLAASWKTSDFNVVYEGWYVILVARTTSEVALSNVEELANLVKITKNITLQETVDVHNEKITKIGSDMIPIAKDLSFAEVPFEMGTITINNTHTDITYSDSTRTIRIPENIGGIPLKIGDRIGLTDYTVAKYALFYYANGEYVSLSTNVADRIVSVDGLYYILIYELNNAIIDNISTYTSLFFVHREKDINDTNNTVEEINDTVEQMSKSLAYIQYPYDIYPIHGINHRGMQYEAPENTLPAFRLSVDAGYHFVETDIQFTSNDVPVLLHDTSINRTARNPDGSVIANTIYINQLTYEQALYYDFSVVNGTYNSEFNGNKIMKFEDFIIFCKRTKLFPYLELKSEAEYTQSQVNMLIDILKCYNMLRNVSWISWSDAHLRLIINADKGARVGRVKNSQIDNNAVAALNSFKTGYNRVFWSFSPYENNTWKLTEQSIINAKNANQGLSIGVISTKAGMLNVLNHFENSGYISGCLSNERVNFADLVKNIALGNEQV